PPAALAPGLPLLAAAPQVGQRKDATGVEPLEQWSAEGGRLAHRETAVAGEDGGILAVELEALLVHNEDRDLGAVLRGVPLLLDLDRRRIDGHSGPLPELGLGAGLRQIDAVD